MKYLVSVNETVYYQSIEIEAEDEDQAGEIYMNMLLDGNVPDVNQEFDEIKVSNIK